MACFTRILLPFLFSIFLATPSVGQFTNSCDDPVRPAGCSCYGTDSCSNGLLCAGNSTEYSPGTCGGDLNTITCPRTNQTDYIDFWIQNTTADYCANTQIRTCADGNGCVGVKYRNDTSTYLRCVQEYGNPTTGHAAAGGMTLPAKLRIAPDTKYITFVCDPDPGVKVPIVSEYWPLNAGVWPKSIPDMGKSNCSSCTGTGVCPWKTDGPGSECDCCTDCPPDHSEYPPQFNISISNPTQHPWKVELSLNGSPHNPFGFQSTCVVRNTLDCDGYESGCSEAIIEQYQASADAAQATQIPPGAENFMIGIPPGVQGMTVVPLYTSVLSTCVVEFEGGVQKKIVLGDNTGGQDCRGY